MGFPKLPTKDPDTVKKYGVNWTPYLNGLTITDSTWELPDGITEDPVLGNDHDDVRTWIHVTGGTVPDKYELVNHITKSDGTTEDQTVIVPMKDR